MPTPNTGPAKHESARGLSSLERALLRSDARDVSMVVVRIEDLPELRSIYGPAFYQLAIQDIQRVLGKIIRGKGVGARTGPTEYTLALPNLHEREILALLSARLGQPERFEIDADGAEIVLVPEITTDLIGHGESIRQCHARLRAELLKSIDRESARLAGMTKSRENIVKRAAEALQIKPAVRPRPRAVSLAAA